MSTCNLSGKALRSSSDVYLTFIVPTLIAAPQLDIQKNVIYDDGSSRLSHISNDLNYCFMNYASTRISFDLVYYYPNEFEFNETPSNILSLRNLLSILKYDFQARDDIAIEFLESGEKSILESYRTKFSKEYAEELFENKQYNDCFSYIIRFIDYLYVDYIDTQAKLFYSLVSAKTMEIIQSDYFLDKYFDIDYQYALEGCAEEEVDMENCEEMMNGFTVSSTFDNIVSPFYYNPIFESDEEAKITYKSFVKTAFLDFIYSTTRTILAPSYERENVFTDCAMIIKHELISHVIEEIH